MQRVPPNKLFMITKVLTSPLKFVKIGVNPHPTEQERKAFYIGESVMTFNTIITFQGHWKLFIGFQDL